ncbi:MAG: thioredoxin domain-containing protein [Thermodesulfobacteriota bacterium]
MPGAEPFPADLARCLGVAAARRAREHAPRTSHLAPDGAPLYTNRLVLETSPYLQQHAHNPVDWYPWGEDAFAAARRLGRPIFLSIGYSTCHWCHVMERESFEDVEIARLLNERFVAVKVDREERPDVDEVYMSAVLALSGGGGWPMTVVMTPDGEPFFGGTYLPPRDGERGLRTGLATVLQVLAERYASDRDQVVAHAADVARAVREAARPPAAGAVPDAAPLHAAVRTLHATFDAENGGFGGAPKFPRTVTLELLLRHHRRTGDPESLAMVLTTLDRMAAGGVRDHVGGGFHRYATDAAWRVPHFEKMLYDNALLAVAYLEAFQATGERRFADVARDTLDYLAREMMSEQGALHAATDADSLSPAGREEEGRFFTWTPDELEAVLGPDRARLFAARHGVTLEGNLDGRSVLHLARPLEDVARESGLDVAQLDAEIEGARRLLHEARARRPAPLRDDKVIAAWNGLAISAFARAGRVLGEPRFTAHAARAADFVLGEMVEDGELRRTWIAGEARHDAVLEDHAFVIAGLLDLHEATFDARWLEAALGLQARLDARFADDEAGGYFATRDDGERLLARAKPSYDGALPSGNSVAAQNLLRLYELTGDERHRERAQRLLGAFAQVFAAMPASFPRMLAALDFALDTPKEVVVIAPSDVAEARPLLGEVARIFLPNAVLVAASEHDAADAAGLVPLLADKRALGGKPTAYVCERRVCKLPTSDVATLRRQLATVTPYPSP